MGRRFWIATIGAVLTLVAAILLIPRSSYQPGSLLKAHAQLEGTCTSCHQPWRGPSNARCINCHGDISDSNKHSGVDATGDSGLMPGRHLALTSLNNISCLSCHTEHQGRVVDIKVTAAFACQFCHQHPTIGAVPEHIAEKMKRQFLVRHLYVKPFNHDEHRLLMSSAYPPRPGGFNCQSCHSVEPISPGSVENMKFKWTGCAGTGCHVTPQDTFMQMSNSVGTSPHLIAYSGVIPVRHINAVFVHSSGHLRSACEECHSKMASSSNPNDEASLAIKRCFTCHAHDPASAERAAVLPVHPVGIGRVAFAAEGAENPVPAEKAVVRCGECHLFHTYGVVPLTDFSTPAPEFPPNGRPRLALILYVPHLRTTGSTGSPSISMERVQLSPWWIGILAFAVLTGLTMGWVRLLPRKEAAQEVVAGVAPQVAREVPAIDDTYQTNIPHLYIIGEAAGTASINLAMRTGRQVIDAIVNELRIMGPLKREGVYDVVIVGCGPAGLGATATAKAAGLNYATVEKMTPASTLRSYPRAKFVQATPIDIAEYGSFFLEGDNSREELIAVWEKVITQTGLKIHEREEVINIRRETDFLAVETERGSVFRGRCVVLAIGVRGNPRHLNLQGEIPSRVVYNLIEPGEYRGRKILVVGGGNAGAEVVQALAAPELNNTVSYSFRAPVLTNVTRENAERISALLQSKRLTIYPASALKEIRRSTVILEPVKTKAMADAPTSAAPVGPSELDNDVIFAMIGAELPTSFLKSFGVKMVSKGRWQT